MKGWALAASGHPTWSVVYAQDVPRLLAEIQRLYKEMRRLSRELEAEEPS